MPLDCCKEFDIRIEAQSWYTINVTQEIVFLFYCVWSDTVDFAHTGGSNYKYHLSCAQNRICLALTTIDLKKHFLMNLITTIELIVYHNNY